MLSINYYAIFIDCPLTFLLTTYPIDSPRVFPLPSQLRCRYIIIIIIIMIIIITIIINATCTVGTFQ